MSEYTLYTWEQENPNVNPFEGCTNIDNLGGAEFLWTEFLYRYGNKEVFDPEKFPYALKRVFVINQYKFAKMLASLSLQYNPLDNYRVEKTGSENRSLNNTRNKTGTETEAPLTTSTETYNLSTNEVMTPTTKMLETEVPNQTTTETFTPTTEDTTVREPDITSTTTDTPGVKTKTTTKPADYTDEQSKTTYDSQTYSAVAKNTRQYSQTYPEETTVEYIGNGENVSEVNQTGTETTTLSHTGHDTTVSEVHGTNEKTTEYKSGNVTTNTGKTGTVATAKTGTDTLTFNTTVADAGSNNLSFVNRKDSGFMYRNPQDAIKDERLIANFSLIDVILTDCEQATLVSVY